MKSKKSFKKTAYFALFLQIFTFSVVRAADISATVSISADGKAEVKGKFENGFTPLNERNFYFRLAVDEVRGRLSDVRLFDDGGKEVGFRELIPGEYLAELPYRAFEYKINLSAPDTALSGHRSSINSDFAVLYADSLLPGFELRGRRVSARIRMILPTEWTDWEVFSADAISDSEVEFPDLSKGTVICGRGIRSAEFGAGKVIVRLLIAGKRDFSDAEAEEMIKKILGFYTQQIGRLNAERVQVAVLPSGDPARSGRWEAETRGRSVLVVSADMPFPNQSRQRLHEQLRHELFHLWFPAGVDLNGDYSIFYEGLAVYASLRAGVELRQIRFEDMLATLLTAIVNVEMDSLRPTDRSGIYSLGAIAAFTADLSRLERSRGSKGLLAETSRIWGLYGPENRQSNNRPDGEEVFRNAFGFEISQTLSRLRPAITAAGLEFSGGRLRVLPKIDGRQKAILRKIGYNQ